MTEEGKIQRKIIAELNKLGWSVYKMELSVQAYPDLICMKAPAQTRFIEVKAPGKQPSKLQWHRIKTLREMGFKVYVFDNHLDAIKHFVV